MKNARALQVLARILSGAMWLNLHYLPPNRSVLEVRVKEVSPILVWLVPKGKRPGGCLIRDAAICGKVQG